MPDLNRVPGFLLQLPNGRNGWLVARRVRVFRRTVAVLVWTIAAMPIQALCLAVPGHAKVTFARLYWAAFARLIGIEVRVVADACAGVDDDSHAKALDILRLYAPLVEVTSLDDVLGG